ncbi:MAG TPA: TetR/AcrR family transcriptional regulator [Candidatus Binataceae bacterium]|jgi:TetR/AcrR family transcriptional regulator|nr:TetR/AcrR family transcriptional regulator [Candidatus Binataceae bacterium]
MPIPTPPDGTRRTRRRPVSAAAREAILKAAEDEFAERGFGGARAQSIATRAGVNKALPFYHFGSKAELYDEVVRRALGRLGEFMADALVAPTPRERLGSFVHRLFAYLADNPNWARLIVREVIDEQSHAREIASQYLKPLVDGGREVMMHDMETGMMRKVDPIQLIVSITVETFGYFLLLPALQYIGIANPLSPASLAARERMVINVLGDGLGMAGPESGTRD